MELALRVDNMEASVPQLYRSHSSPSTIGSRPDPARRAGKMHDSERGPRARKEGHHPTGGAPSMGPPGADGAQLGVYESTKGHLYPPTRTGYLPSVLALSLMPQLHDAMEREPGGKSFGTASIPTGPAPAHGRPGADTTFPGTAQLDAQGLSTRAGDYHPSSAASGQRPRARPNAWNIDSEGCRTQEARILPTALLPRDGPAREVPSWFRH